MRAVTTASEDYGACYALLSYSDPRSGGSKRQQENAARPLVRFGLERLVSVSTIARRLTSPT